MAGGSVAMERSWWWMWTVAFLKQSANFSSCWVMSASCDCSQTASQESSGCISWVSVLTLLRGTSPSSYSFYMINYQTGSCSKLAGVWKYLSTWASVTSQMCLCDHFGSAPLSTSTVRTPSAKLGSTIACWHSRQSVSKHSFSDLPAASRTRRCTMPTERGHCSLRALVMPMQNLSLSSATRLQMAWMEPSPKISLICSSWAMIFLPEGRWYLLKTVLIVSLASLEAGRAWLIYSQATWTLSRGMKQWASPERQTSSPFSLEPVMARQLPMLLRRRARRQLEPTSVKNPSLASGMANIECSVAMMKGAKALTPKPPPITIPSQFAICTAFSCEIRQSRLNSSRKKVSLSATVASLSKRAFTSPPAQKALPPAPSSQKAGDAERVGSSLFRSRIICRFKELRALGRLRTTLRRGAAWKSMLPTERT